MRTVDVSWSTLLSASFLPAEDTPTYEEAAVSRPPSESLAASKANRIMQHLTRLCVFCMPGRVSLGLWDVQQALVNDSSSVVDRPMVD